MGDSNLDYVLRQVLSVAKRTGKEAKLLTGTFGNNGAEMCFQNGLQVSSESKLAFKRVLGLGCWS